MVLLQQTRPKRPSPARSAARMRKKQEGENRKGINREQAEERRVAHTPLRQDL